MRIVTIQVYFKDSPTPWTFQGVTNLITEGGLLRITQGIEENQWFPLCGIFRVKELARDELT